MRRRAGREAKAPRISRVRRAGPAQVLSLDSTGTLYCTVYRNCPHNYELVKRHLKKTPSALGGAGASFGYLPTGTVLPSLVLLL